RRAVARDRQVDQARVESREGLVVEAETVEIAGAEVLDEHVAAGEQPAKDLATGVLAQVQPDGALVAVDREVVGRRPRGGVVVADPRRAPAAERGAIRR